MELTHMEHVARSNPNGRLGYIYLAAGWFTVPQEEAEADARDLITQLPDDAIKGAFFPRLMGMDFRRMPEEQRPQASVFVLTCNIGCLQLCAGTPDSFVLANVDDRDTGVAWEHGFAFPHGLPVVTYSTKGHGANAMIAGTSVLHLSNVTELAAFMNILSKISCFDAAVRHYRTVGQRQLEVEE